MARWRALLPGWHWATLESVALPALTTLVGLQLLRVLLNGLVFYLRDSLGAPTTSAGIYALLLFLTAFLAAPLARFVSPRRAMVAIVGALAAVRLAEQLVGEPAADLALATPGTALFLLSIPFLLGRSSGPRLKAGETFALGLLLGIAADTAIKGASATLDLSWQSAPLAAVVVVATVAALAWLVWRAATTRDGADDARRPFAASLPLLALGPLLFLELLLFQNVGQQTVLLDWAQPRALAWVCLANTLGIVAAVALIGWRRSPGLVPAALVGLLLVLAVSGERSGAVAAAAALVGQVALALLVTQIGMAWGHSRAGSGLGTVAVGLGMLLFVGLMFAYYAGYELAMPVDRSTLLMAGAAFVVAAGVHATRLLDGVRRDAVWEWTPARAAAVLLLLPLAYSLAWDEPETAAGDGLPVRVMAYNLHQGFDTSGRLDMEALAQVIEGEAPDIVALQEVSRGWAIDGAFDMLPWLSRRLDMPYVWGPAADSVWGNAVLSRYPIVHAETHPMPNNHRLRLDRAFTVAVVDVGGGERLNVIATHLHHPRDGGPERVPQVQALLDYWGGAGKTVLLGDLNALPDEPEIALLRDAGLVDAFESAGAEPPGYTAPSDDPQRRIDYIWLSDDLGAADFVTRHSLASDHFAVAATIDD